MLIALNTESTKYFTEDTEKIIKNHHHHNKSVAHCNFYAVGNQGAGLTANGERRTTKGERPTAKGLSIRLLVGWIVNEGRISKRF